MIFHYQDDRWWACALYCISRLLFPPVHLSSEDLVESCCATFLVDRNNLSHASTFKISEFHFGSVWCCGTLPEVSFTAVIFLSRSESQRKRGLYVKNSCLLLLLVFILRRGNHTRMSNVCLQKQKIEKAPIVVFWDCWGRAQAGGSSVILLRFLSLSRGKWNKYINKNVFPKRLNKKQPVFCWFCPKPAFPRRFALFISSLDPFRVTSSTHLLKEKHKWKHKT